MGESTEPHRALGDIYWGVGREYRGVWTGEEPFPGAGFHSGASHTLTRCSDTNLKMTKTKVVLYRIGQKSMYFWCRLTDSLFNVLMFTSFFSSYINSSVSCHLVARLYSNSLLHSLLFVWNLSQRSRLSTVSSRVLRDCDCCRISYWSCADKTNRQWRISLVYLDLV